MLLGQSTSNPLTSMPYVLTKATSLLWISNGHDGWAQGREQFGNTFVVTVSVVCKNGGGDTCRT